jgi:hypothetical protein
MIGPVFLSEPDVSRSARNTGIAHAVGSLLSRCNAEQRNEVRTSPPGWVIGCWRMPIILSELQDTQQATRLIYKPI